MRFCSWLAIAAMACAAQGIMAAPQAAEKTQVDVAIVEEGEWSVPEDLTLRARVTKITPAEPTAITWRYGGEAQGGEVIRGTLCEAIPVGEWSPTIPVTTFTGQRKPARLFVTFMVGRSGTSSRSATGERITTGHSRDVELEFEFAYRGKVIKRFTEAGPDGGTVGILLPFYRLAGGKTPESPEFLADLCGLLEYAQKRAAYLEALPWANGPVPKRFMVVTDAGGYGEGQGYGIRTTNKLVVEAEGRSLRQLGINSLRAAPRFLLEMAFAGTGFGKEFGRGHIASAAGYPVPAVREGRPAPPEAGCPFAPGVAARTREGIQQSLELLKLPIPEVWALTVDEIGAVVDGAPEKKSHPAVCEYCAAGFREYVRGLGYTPADFGKADWSQVRPVDTANPEKPLNLEDPGTALAAYATSMFINYASARLFTPLRDTFAKANEEKRRALARGERESSVARQPYVYTYALRGNTFLMSGHSLDFFEFYRYADNAFVYETSNREPRIWSWDSYLCDVGRIVSDRQKIQFGIYVKPHRGAPFQRMLSAVSRGARMIYWYTYGPDYFKGDSFSEDPKALEETSKAAHLLGKAEEALYGATWMKPAEVAVVSPRSSEIWMRLSGNAPERVAAWENAKWIYTALAHAHLPVDALDEEMLATDDLSRYRALYVNGPNLTRKAAEKIAQWVQDGGTLYTSGGGLCRDEANRPLTALQAVLGLKTRRAPEIWYRVEAYRATALEPYDDPARAIAPVPAGARVTGKAPFDGSFPLRIGREVLDPAQGTEVLARFADGGAAVTRHAYGKGSAYVVGFFPGLEYSAPLRTDRYDMSRDFDSTRRQFVVAPALAVVRPVVDADRPTVEGILLKNAENGKRAVSLMNWAYRVAALRRRPGGALSPTTALVPCQNLNVAVRGAGPTTRVVSLMLGKPLPMSRTRDGFSVTLPRLEEGDVLLLE